MPTHRTNAVIVWNTVYIQAVLEQLRSVGYAISDADVGHLSPALYEHINPYGRYHFDVDRERGRSDLRKRRKPGGVDP